jgi:hypothetical protein
MSMPPKTVGRSVTMPFMLHCMSQKLDFSVAFVPWRPVSETLSATTAKKNEEEHGEDSDDEFDDECDTTICTPSAIKLMPV